MKKVRREHKLHLQTRMVLIFAGFTTVLLVLTMIIFQLLLRWYIYQNVELQLAHLVENVQETKRIMSSAGLTEEGQKGSPDQEEPAAQDSSADYVGELYEPAAQYHSAEAAGALGLSTVSPGKIPEGYWVLGRGETAFVMDASGNVLDVLGDENGSFELVANQIKEQGLLPDRLQNSVIHTEKGIYYVSSSEDILRPDAYMILYIDVTSVMNLASSIRLTLLILLFLFLLLSFLCAYTVSRKHAADIRKLAVLSEKIGRGDFSHGTFDFHDIELDQLGNALNSAASQLEETTRKQEIFFQNVSHELRTPLMGIRCFAEGISCGLMDPEESAGIIISETDRLSEMVEELLYISRMSRGGIMKGGRKLDLRDTLSYCAGTIHRMAEEKGVTLRYDFDDQPVMFCCDEKDMEKIADNLLTNALRYAVSEILLECRSKPDGIHLSIANDGEAVLPEEREKIFERFYKGKGGVTGIGLSIVKSVVELYGGEIRVICDDRTRFQIHFPSSTTPGSGHES